MMNYTRCEAVTFSTMVVGNVANWDSKKKQNKLKVEIIKACIKAEISK